MTNHNGVTFVASTPNGSPGFSAQFNGSNYIRADSATGYNNVLGSFSVAFWMDTSVTSKTGTQWYQGVGLVDAETPGVTSDWGISLLNNKVAFGIGGDTTIQSTSSVTDGKWHFITATWNQPSGIMDLYVDSTLQVIGNGGTSLRTAENHLTLGGISTNEQPGNRYSGLLSNVQIYNTVLTQAQITGLQTPLTTVPVPAAIWMFASGLLGLGALRRKNNQV